ncbi:30S ribosomal protein S6 [Mesorhizobium sp. BR1-1-16]|uniref:30S ribosomal protein S6 n=1 Tax=Mesorhizobium sp. BR1-1-16 TaxID=2876653 RepID=UPI001CCAFE93|nr:30S ribosomal protein S6 [Mesorhizobium sp. BR1-1-16]MBZ9935124.1 30S ribosomal protein S6 [Mesorhizobium sp. BR1-1-16]
MPLYEHVFLSRQDVSAQQVETLTETFKGILEANGGSVAKIEQWGLKSVAFRIRKNRKAHYTLLNIDAPAAAVAELERQQRINEDVLRVLTIRVDALEEGQSAMLQKRDRDDRDGDRGGRFGDRGDRPRSFGGGGGGGFRGDREGGGGGGGGFRGERRPRSEETEGGAE